MSGIKVFAPATVSNLSCGFDILGLALDFPGDEIIARKTEEPGVKITKISGAMTELSKDPTRNTAGIAALAVMKHLSIDNQGMEIELFKKMPIGSGLGSSAASAVAGAMAANAVFGNKLSKEELLPFASKGEQFASGGNIHLDNVAPSLLGGITLNRSNTEFDVCRLHFPDGLYCVVVYPEIQILTKEARNMLKKEVPLSDHIQQSANLAGLISGLYTSNFDLIQRSLVDLIIEPQRAKLIPGFYEVQKAALNSGALGSSISGAGPSVYALCRNNIEAENCALEMQKAFFDKGIQSRIFFSPINKTGAVVL